MELLQVSIFDILPEKKNYFSFIPETINEETARRAKENISWSDYKPGSATASYMADVQSVIDLAEEYASKSKYITEEPERIAEAQRYINYYSRKAAAYINKDNEITCRCPSVMIAGPANFPTKKKQKQVAAWDANHRDNYISFDSARYKLRYILLEEHAISGADPNAITKLENKLRRLEEDYKATKEAFSKAQKQFNAELKAGIIKEIKHYYGCRIPDGYTENDRDNPDMIAKLPQWERDNMIGTIYIKDGKTIDKPTLGYRSGNASQERQRLKRRIEELKKAQEEPKREASGEGWKLYEDTEAGRICFDFDGKPEQNIISALKSNGFKWSPSNKRWQRQNTENGKRAADTIKVILSNIDCCPMPF